MACKHEVSSKSLTIKFMQEKRAILAKKMEYSCSFLLWSQNTVYSKPVSSMVRFLLPRYMCHQGCIQAQRPAGRASWPAALCTSSLLHIWMYLRSTTNHQNQYTSQRRTIQPTAQLFSYAAQANILRKSIKDVESHR